MSLAAQKNREIVFQILFSLSSGCSDEKGLIKMIMRQHMTTKKNVYIAFSRARQVLEQQEKLDALIEKVSKSYEFSRIQIEEKSILRLGIFELLYDTDIPEKVAISEAIRLAKKYSSPAATTFINALLDEVYKTEVNDDVS